MVPAIIDFAHKARRDFGIAPGRVLEVGSLDVNGSVREVFEPGSQCYRGIDRAPGPGVDEVMDGRAALGVFGYGVFDTVVCCECLEHDPRPWELIAAMHGLLAPGGHLFVSTPTFGFPYHGYPKDYWRLSEDAFREVVFEGFELLRLSTVVDTVGQPCVVGVGRR